MTAVRDGDFLAVDFETTGTNPRRAEPLSAGWVAVVGGRIRMATAGYAVLSTDTVVPVASMPIHRLLPTDLAVGTSPAALAEALRTALSGRWLVAHGAGLELAALKRLGLRWRRRDTIDTLQLARHLEGEHPDRPLTLSALSERYGLPAHRPHHAFGDSMSTAQLLLALVARMEIDRRRLTVDDLRHLGRPA